MQRKKKTFRFSASPKGRQSFVPKQNGVKKAPPVQFEFTGLGKQDEQPGFTKEVEQKPHFAKKEELILTGATPDTLPPPSARPVKAGAQKKQPGRRGRPKAAGKEKAPEKAPEAAVVVKKTGHERDAAPGPAGKQKKAPAHVKPAGRPAGRPGKKRSVKAGINPSPPVSDLKKGRVILVSIDEYEHRVAIMEDGKLTQFFLSRSDRQIGSIYKGRIINVLPGMSAAFVNIGLERNAFLCMDDALFSKSDVDPEELRRLSIRDILKVNQETLVQVVKESVGTKGARVTTNLTLPGRYMVLLPRVKYIGVSRKIEDPRERERLRKLAQSVRPKDMGIIIRTAASGKKKGDLSADVKSLVGKWEDLQQKAGETSAPALIHQELSMLYKTIRDLFTSDTRALVIDSREEYFKAIEMLESIGGGKLLPHVYLYDEMRSMFEDLGVEDDLEHLLARKILLPSGGSILIEKTEAFTAIDVNTGSFVGKKYIGETILKTNLEAAEEVARQLRLRDIGGVIIVDFIDMEHSKDRNRLMHAQTAALKRDVTKAYCVEMTELGHVLITRKRIGRDLDEMMRQTCPHCGGKGKILSANTMAIKLAREVKHFSKETSADMILIEANPAVALQLLSWEGEELKRLETLTGKQLFLRAQPQFPQERFELSNIKPRNFGKNVILLNPGETFDIFIDWAAPPDSRNGIGIRGGNIVEIEDGGHLNGKSVTVTVIEAGRHRVRAKLEE
ncbi:MAG: Rne/Rng family ribonuclease [Chloroflexi bacterium]|nr:Rne/Rng family ribonuclease [Chloroflexota bacterium]